MTRLRLLLWTFVCNKGFGFIPGRYVKSRTISIFSSSIQSEVLITNNPSFEPIAILSRKRPNLQIREISPYSSTTGVWAHWSVHTSRLELDGTELEPYFLGAKPYTDKETADLWINVINNRLSLLNGIQENYEDLSYVSQDLIPGFNRELNSALSLVTKASRVSRSLQSLLISRTGATKNDSSPVTIADFFVQALVIDGLSKIFPQDKFIAEEDSQILRSDSSLRSSVLEALSLTTGEQWTAERLYDTIDYGQFQGSAERVWVLDPVDGTKGFMRGEHYCIACALLVNGQPRVSVLGCPNLNLKRALQRDSLTKISEVAAIDPRIVFDAVVDGDSHVDFIHHPESGSVFFAVSGCGAYARSLSMPLGAAFEISVSGERSISRSVLCESVEATYGDRSTTQLLSGTLGLTNDFLRMDGQNKYCAVACGAAEANLRLPQLQQRYQEKIWDHAPGSHLVTEAGGLVTDLQGNKIDFSQGRLLDKSVSGIVSSNSHVHKILLRSISEIRN